MGGEKGVGAVVVAVVAAKGRFSPARIREAGDKGPGIDDAISAALDNCSPIHK